MLRFPAKLLRELQFRHLKFPYVILMQMSIHSLSKSVTVTRNFHLWCKKLPLLTSDCLPAFLGPGSPDGCAKMEGSLIFKNDMPILRSAFIALSRNATLRNFSERSSVGRRMSSRFVAGMTLDEVIHSAEALGHLGIASTLDSLGENVTTPQEARHSADIYHRLLDAIQARNLNANVSVKLTQMGMDLGLGLAEEIVAGLVEHAVAANTFVRVDMEGSEYTQATIDMVRRLHAIPRNHSHVGIVIQAYLYRSEEDIRTLTADGIRIRLCKGAYKEPPDITFPDKKDVDTQTS